MTRGEENTLFVGDTDSDESPEATQEQPLSPPPPPPPLSQQGRRPRVERAPRTQINSKSLSCASGTGRSSRVPWAEKETARRNRIICDQLANYHRKMKAKITKAKWWALQREIWTKKILELETEIKKKQEHLAQIEKAKKNLEETHGEAAQEGQEAMNIINHIEAWISLEREDLPDGFGDDFYDY